MSKKDMFYNIVSLDECFDKFYEHREEYDAIICVNDFVAIMFVERMKELDPDYLDNRFVVGFMDTVIARLYHYSITSISYDIEDVNVALCDIYRSFAKHRKHIQAISIDLADNLFPRDSTQSCPLTSEMLKSHYNLDYFNHRNLVFPKDENRTMKHENPTINLFLRIENMRAFMDLTDIKIMHLFLKGYKNSDVCTEMYVSFKTVQYRSKKCLRNWASGINGSLLSFFPHA